MKRVLILVATMVLVLSMMIPPVALAQTSDVLPAEDTRISRVSPDLLSKPQWVSQGSDVKVAPKRTNANKYAVVIGIANYRGTGSDLWHSDEDAKEMKEALIDNYGFPKKNIKTLLNAQATAAAIDRAISWLKAKEDEESTVVFFFSGHGFRAPDGENWDYDSEADGYDEGIVSHDLYGLPDGWLRAKFANFESQKISMVFCSCHAGGMFDDNDDLQGTGRVICSACGADQLGWDYYNLGNTLFGYYFVDEGILQELADQNADGSSMEEALAYAYTKVVDAQKDSQPQLYDNYSGELIP